MRQQGNEGAAVAAGWQQQTLDEILARVRQLLDVSGCAFQVVDWKRRLIRPAAAWFADEETARGARRRAHPALRPRPRRRHRGGDRVRRVAAHRDRRRVARAQGLRRRLEEQLTPDAAARAWAWYESSSYISCPVRTTDGRTLGVLAISRRRPQPPLTGEDLRVVEIFADLAALALERARQAREQEQLGEAAREVAR